MLTSSLHALLPPSAVTCSAVGYFAKNDNNFGPSLALVKVFFERPSLVFSV
jgi:hypothetical protein